MRKIEGVASADEIRAKVVADVPLAYQGLLERALHGKASPRAAIKAKCLECVGYTRKDITECVAVRCPLHPYRPYQTK